jgi:hypothetical protein
MKLINSKTFSTQMLIMYLISALLFMTSIDLHIHADVSSLSADKLTPVHISSIADSFTATDDSGEININHQSVLKDGQGKLVVLAAILLTLMVAALFFYECIGRIVNTRVQLYQLPFLGTPPLRGPPVYNA